MVEIKVISNILGGVLMCFMIMVCVRVILVFMFVFVVVLEVLEVKRFYLSWLLIVVLVFVKVRDCLKSVVFVLVFVGCFCIVYESIFINWLK